MKLDGLERQESAAERYAKAEQERLQRAARPLHRRRSVWLSLLGLSCALAAYIWPGEVFGTLGWLLLGAVGLGLLAGRQGVAAANAEEDEADRRRLSIEAAHKRTGQVLLAQEEEERALLEHIAQQRDEEDLKRMQEERDESWGLKDSGWNH